MDGSTFLRSVSGSGSVSGALKPECYRSVLAILAHEIGHILWWDKNVGNRTCVKASQSRFSNYSWPSNQVAHGFHRLGQQDKQNRTTDRPDKDDVLLDFRYDNPPGSSNYPDAVADLQTMYLSGNWASLFAIVIGR